MMHTVPRLARGLLACFWTSSAVLVLSSGPVDSPLRSSRSVRQSMIAISPQGWAFFTRDPREPVDRLYRATASGWVPATYTNSSARNFFGLSRAARALNVEMAALLAEISQDRWTECRSTLESCLWEDSSPAAVVNNPSLTRQVCGAFAVQRQPTVPWAWSRSAARIHMPSEVVQFDARCSEAR